MRRARATLPLSFEEGGHRIECFTLRRIMVWEVIFQETARLGIAPESLTEAMNVRCGPA